MTHDPLCEQKYQPYEEDGRCHDCAIIDKVKRENGEALKEMYFKGFHEGFQSAQQPEGENVDGEL